MSYEVIGLHGAFSFFLLIVFVIHIIETAAKRPMCHNFLTIVRIMTAVLAVLVFISG